MQYVYIYTFIDLYIIEKLIWLGLVIQAVRANVQGLQLSIWAQHNPYFLKTPLC